MFVVTAYFLSMDVEMRHLRALLTVAEELNFTRAAQRLHLSQQALSGQIRQLEDRVGTRLVERDTRRVALTAAGVALSEQARPLLAKAEQAVAAARAAGAQRTRLTIGHIAPQNRRRVAPAVRDFSDAHPEVELIIHFATAPDPLGGLREGRADVAILAGEFEHDGIELRPLFSEPRGVALAAEHPLAAQPEVSLADFLAEPLVEVLVRDPVWRDFWIAAKHRRGKPPRIAATVQWLDGMFEAIGAGLGVAATPASLVEELGSAAGVVFRAVPGLEPLDFWIARRSGDDRPQVLEFLATAEAAMRDPATHG
jgi:DNA-binding transcriptional LysR family regulator